MHFVKRLVTVFMELFALRTIYYNFKYAINNKLTASPVLYINITLVVPDLFLCLAELANAAFLHFTFLYFAKAAHNCSGFAQIFSFFTVFELLTILWMCTSWIQKK